MSMMLVNPYTGSLFDHFAPTIYTGDGNFPRGFVNGVDVSAGAVWVRGRSASNAFGIAFNDAGTVRAKDPGVQTDWATPAFVLNSDGFTVVNSGASLNTSAATYIAWCFKKLVGFFEPVTWVGDGAASKTISHTLGAAPGMILARIRGSSGDWNMYHRAMDATSPQNFRMRTTLTNARASNTIWNNSAPTSTQFQVGSGLNSNTFSFHGFLFGHDTSASGRIQCGGYTGNGSASGPSVSLGWQPRFLFITRATTVGSFIMLDTGRTPSFSGNDAVQALPSVTADSTTTDLVALITNGFQIVSTDTRVNNSGDTYLYVAVR